MSVNRTTGGALLIAGTCIGAGMLALPITTASSGFLASSVLLIFAWLSMVLTALYVLEVNLWLPPSANFISMAKVTLGKAGEFGAWLTYLLLLYSLIAAYLSGGGDIISQGLKLQSLSLGPLMWVILGCIIVYAGVRYVDGINRLLMIGLILAYLLLIAFTFPHVELNYLKGGHPHFLWAALPIVITSFGYHVIIPSLRVYLSSDAHKLKRIIVWGSLIPLIVYLLWELAVFGTVPIQGDNGIIEIYKSGRPATVLTQALSTALHNTWIVICAEFFIFFAIATSFLGIAMSLFDFLADGFAIPKTIKGKGLIALLTFGPPLLYTYFFPKGFILALSYAGVFVAILHGILPALMLWVGRAKGLKTDYRAPGGIAGMIIILLFSIVIIFSQVALNLNWISNF